MTHVLQSFSTDPCGSGWLLWFAQESNQDFDLNDDLDDFDDEQPQPPSRRPLLIILLLLLVAGAGYIAMNPHLLSSITSMIAAPGSQSADDPMLNSGPGTSPSADQPHAATPSPTYQEGELVSVRAKAGNPLPISLSRDAQGTDPGPKVLTGELLTIVDGAFVNQSWMYLVNTKSGATGWIDEHQIQPHS